MAAARRPQPPATPAARYRAQARALREQAEALRRDRDAEMARIGKGCKVAIGRARGQLAAVATEQRRVLEQLRARLADRRRAACPPAQRKARDAEVKQLEQQIAAAQVDQRDAVVEGALAATDPTLIPVWREVAEHVDPTATPETAIKILETYVAEQPGEVAKAIEAAGEEVAREIEALADAAEKGEEAPTSSAGAGLLERLQAALPQGDTIVLREKISAPRGWWANLVRSGVTQRSAAGFTKEQAIEALAERLIQQPAHGWSGQDFENVRRVIADAAEKGEPAPAPAPSPPVAGGMRWRGVVQGKLGERDRSLLAAVLPPGVELKPHGGQLLIIGHDDEDVRHATQKVFLRIRRQKEEKLIKLLERATLDDDREAVKLLNKQIDDLHKTQAPEVLAEQMDQARQAAAEEKAYQAKMAAAPPSGTIALVGCGKSKLDHAAPARELYTGPLFRAQLAHAEKIADRVYILSAKYGLVDPDQVIEPYDQKLSDLDKAHQDAWADRVAKALFDRELSKYLKVQIFAGADYANQAAKALRSLGRIYGRMVDIKTPLSGMSQGERLRFFKVEREEGPEATPRDKPAKVTRGERYPVSDTLAHVFEVYLLDGLGFESELLDDEKNLLKGRAVVEAGWDRKAGAIVVGTDEAAADLSDALTWASNSIDGELEEGKIDKESAAIGRRSMKAIDALQDKLRPRVRAFKASKAPGTALERLQALLPHWRIYASEGFGGWSAYAVHDGFSRRGVGSSEREAVINLAEILTHIPLFDPEGPNEGREKVLAFLEREKASAAPSRVEPPPSVVAPEPPPPAPPAAADGGSGQARSRVQREAERIAEAKPHLALVQQLDEAEALGLSESEQEEFLRFFDASPAVVAWRKAAASSASRPVPQAPPPPRPLGPQPTVSLLEVEPPRPASQWGETGALFGNVEPAPTLPVLAFLGIPPRFQADFAEGLRRAGDEAKIMLGILPAPVGSDAASYYEPADVLDDDGSPMAVIEHSDELGRREELAAERGIVLLQASAPMIDFSEVSTLEEEAYDWENSDVGTPPPSLYAVLSSDVWHSPQHHNAADFWRGKLIAERLIGSKLVREAAERGIFFAQGDTFKPPIPQEVSPETAGLSRGQGDALAMAEVAPYRVDLSGVLAELAKAQKDREEEARREKEEEEGEASQPEQISRMDQLEESWDEWAAPIGKSLIPIGTERFTYHMSPERPSELATYYAAPYKRRVSGSLDRNTFLAWGESGPTIVLAKQGKARLVQWPGQGGMGIVFDGDSLEAISVGKLMQGLLLLHRCREELDKLADHPSHRQILASLLSGTKGQILRDSATRPFAKIAAVKEAGSSGQRVYELETSAKVIHQIDRGKFAEWSSVRGSGEREEESADHWQLHGERSILATAKVIRRPSIVPGWRYFVRVQCALLPYELQPLLSQGLDHWATYDLDLPNITVPKIDDRSQRGLQHWDYVFEADPTGETEWIPPLPSELGPVVEVLLKYLFPFVMMERVADEAGGSASVFLSVARFSDALHEGLRPYRERVETRKAQIGNLKAEARRGDAWALPYHRPGGAVGRDHAVKTTVGEVRKEANSTWTIPVVVEGIERTWQIGYNNIPEADRDRVLQALLMVLRDYPSRKRITSTGGVDWSPAVMTDVLNDVAGYLNEQNAEAGPLKIVYVATGSDDKRIGSFYTKNVVATAPNLKKVALSLSVGNRSGQYDVDHLPNGLLVRSFSLAKPAAIGAFHELVQRLGAVVEQDGLDLGFADRAAGRLREAIGRLPESFQVFTDLENRYGKLAEEEKARKAQLKASATTDAIVVIDRAREEDKIDRSKAGTELTRFKEYGKRGALVASAWVVNIGGSLFLNGHVQIGQREAMFLLGIEGAGGAVDSAVRSILENWIRDTNLLDDEASKAMDQALDKGDLTELLGKLVVAYLSKYAKPQIAYGAGREPVNLRELQDAIKSGAVKWAPREEATSFPRAFPLFAEWRGSMFAVTRFKEFSQSLSKASVTALPAGLSVPLDELTEAQKVTVAQALDRVMPWEEPRPLMINFAEKFRDVLKGLNLWPISGATQQKALLDWAKGARGGKRRTPNPSGGDQIARCREARAELAALAADGAAVARRLAEVRRGEIVNQRVAACEAPREEVRRRYDPQIEKLRREAQALEQKARAWEGQEKGRKRGKLPPLDASEQDALIESVLLGLAPELVSYWAEMAGQTKGAGAVERFDAFLAAMGAGAALLPPSAETAEVWAAEGQGERFAAYLTEGLSPEASTLVRLLLAAPDYAAPEHALRRSFSRYYPDPALWWSTVHDLAARSLASHPWALEQTGEDGGTLRLVFSPEAAPPEPEEEPEAPPPPPPPEAAPLSLEPVNEASEAPAPFVPPPAAPLSRWDAPMGDVPLTPQAEALGVKVTMDDLPYEVAKRAHQHTSHVPEERGRMRQREYMRGIEAMAAKVAPLATSPEKKERLRVWLEEYRAGYLQRLQAWLNAESNTASTMITGGSGFNVRRNEKRMNTADNRRKELQDFEINQYNRIKRELGELSTTIRADDPNALESLRAQLKQLDHLQAKKNEIRAIAKNKKLSLPDREKAIEALGFSVLDARSLANGYGLDSQAIRSKRERIEGRIMQLSREQARPRVEVEAQLKGAGGKLWPVRVVDDPDENRIRLHFADRIDAGTAALLKKHGFKWAPSQTAWQRQRTDNAREALRYWFGINLGRASSPSSVPQAGSSWTVLVNDGRDREGREKYTFTIDAVDLADARATVDRWLAENPEVAYVRVWRGAMNNEIPATFEAGPGRDSWRSSERTENPSILERLRGWWARVTAPRPADAAAAPRAAGSFKLAPASKATRGELESWTEPSPYDPRTEENKQAEARFARRIVEDGTPLAFVVKASGGPTLEGSYFVTGPTGGLLSLWEGTHDRRLGAYRNRGEVEQDLALKIGENERWIRSYIDRHYRRTANPSHTSSQTLDRGPDFRLWREHDKVKFAGPYVHGFVKEATAIGGRWNSTDRFWFFEPQHEGAVKALVRRFYRSENPDCGCVHQEANPLQPMDRLPAASRWRWKQADPRWYVLAALKAEKTLLLGLRSSAGISHRAVGGSVWKFLDDYGNEKTFESPEQLADFLVKTYDAKTLHQSWSFAVRDEIEEQEREKMHVDLLNRRDEQMRSEGQILNNFADRASASSIGSLR